MKILLTTDWHLDYVTAGKPRLSEMERHLDDLIGVVADRENEIDLVAFLGDAFDPGQMLGPVYGRVLSRVAGELAQAAPLGVIFIAGNHDVIETSEPRSTLSTLAGIQPRVDGLFIAERSCVHDVENVRFLLLPYVSRAAMKQNPAELESAFGFCGVKARGGKALVVLGHMTIPGAVLGSESRELSRGRDLDLPSLAELEPDLVANGHYHFPSVVRYGGVDIVIPGSPLQLTFGEPEAERGYVLAEVG